MTLQRFIRLSSLLTLLVYQSWTPSHFQVSQDDIFDCVLQASQWHQSLSTDQFDSSLDGSLEGLPSSVEVTGPAPLFLSQNESHEASLLVKNRSWGSAPHLSFLSMFTNSPPTALL